MAWIAHTHSFVVLELALTIATADGTILILWALLGTSASCPVFVTIACSCTIRCFISTFSMTIANCTCNHRTLVAARWALEAFLTVALGRLTIFGGCAHTTTAANLAIFACWARNTAVVTEEPSLAHAFHAFLWGRNTLPLIVARLLSCLVEGARLLTDATTEALLAKALCGESLAFLVTHKKTLTIP